MTPLLVMDNQVKWGMILVVVMADNFFHFAQHEKCDETLC